MRYVMSLSGGLASAVAADRAIARYGRDAVTLWFADVSWEDPDLHRFLADCMARWGGDLITYRDGRTPLQLCEERNLIPNSHIAPCTFDLKVTPFRKYVTALDGPVTVMLGLDWREQHRMASPTAAYAKLGVATDYPLMWKPYEFRPYAEVVAEWGIAIPRLYGLGFSHNNCFGRCVKQGKRAWATLARVLPERFEDVAAWEDRMRAKGGALADRTIQETRVGGKRRPLPLREAVAGVTPNIDGLMDDRFACFCAEA